MPLRDGEHVTGLGIVGQIGFGNPFALFLHLGEKVANFIGGVKADVENLRLQILVSGGEFEQFYAAEQNLGRLPKGMTETGERLHDDLGAFNLLLGSGKPLRDVISILF